MLLEELTNQGQVWSVDRRAGVGRETMERQAGVEDGELGKLLRICHLNSKRSL